MILRVDEFDRTALRSDKDGYRVHRDYAAHYFRWGWAVNRAAGTCGIVGKRVLDVCAGKELMLAHVAEMAARQPAVMVTVDLNVSTYKHHPKWLEASYQANFADIETQRMIWDNHGGAFDVITCFEGIEHMPVESGRALLQGIHRLLADDGFALLSTPVFNGHAAANHIHEYTVEELAGEIAAAGFVVEDRFGTFASANDVKKAMAEWPTEDREVVERLLRALGRFHSPDVLACFLAPIIPDHARNNVWKLRKSV